ncbi:MAG TPA: polysaccharide biosynthesis/export family protein [Candidatus Cybelea sp.]|jgi:polysaccharide export outer membrane protein|nr:polysaccharide biosynthesis/export family protein [Candidatus Cybelea sp.]
MTARFIAALFLAFCLAAPAAAAAQTSTYAIRADDQLQVIVFGTQGATPLQPQGGPAPTGTIQALSQTVTVLSDGTITYPLIGSISVAGLQPDVAAERIAAALGAYVVHPTVSVIVVKGTPATIEVLGSVDHGGQIELQKGDRVVDAIARAGVGPTSSADLNHITLNRLVDGVPHLYNVNLYHMLLNADYASNPTLQPGDVVYVPKARQYNISNLTNIPFALYYLYLLINPAAGICCGPK